MKLDPKRWFVLLAALGLMASGPGCAAYQPTQSGYLGNYAQLQKDPIHLNYGLGLQRVKSHNALAEASTTIDSFYIEPVAWMVDESSRAGGDPKRRDSLTASLDQALRNQLGKLKPIVDQPGPKTAKVRAAITNVKLSRPYLNLALLPTLITPVKVGPIFNGGGFVEAEVIGPDGNQIAAVTVASAGGPLDLFGYYTRARHARQAMQRSAWELRETLEVE